MPVGLEAAGIPVKKLKHEVSKLKLELSKVRA